MGVVGGRYFFLPPWRIYLLSLLLSFLLLFFWVKRKDKPLLFSFLPLFFLFGVLLFWLSYYPCSSEHIFFTFAFSQEVELEGRVVAPPEKKTWKRKQAFPLEAEKVRFLRYSEGGEKANFSPWQRTRGKIWVNLYGKEKSIFYGDRLILRGRLRIPREKGKFNWKRYLSYQGIWVELHTGRVKIKERGKGNWLLAFALQKREKLKKIVEKTLPSPYGEVLKGIMLGEKGALPREILEKFRQTGTAHILVVSGLHVGLLFFISLILLRALGLSFKHISLLSFPFLGFYALLTGLRVPVVRATLMAWVGILGVLLNRDVHPLIFLSLACFILLIFSPLSLFTPSFQLSFIAVGGIIWLTPYFLRILPSLPFPLKESLGISLAAQASVIPLLGFYFHTLPLVGVLTNLLITPLVAFILALGFLTVVFGEVSFWLAQIFAHTNYLFLWVLLRVVGIFSFSSFPLLQKFFSPSLSSLPGWALFLYYPLLVLLPLFKKD